jgi:AraC-like DNA-binding protein
LKVEEFNIDSGLYIFEIEDFESEFHSHPSLEIIIAHEGTFALLTDTEIHEGLKFGLMSANHRHKLSATNCKLKIIMIEHHNKFVRDNLRLCNDDLSGCYFAQSNPYRETNQIEKLVEGIRSGRVWKEYDCRINDVVEYLNQNDLPYDAMIKTLQSLTNLSESRLSHLFKSNIGISLKKYLIWSKLKSAIKYHLESKDDLFSALIKSGFYDQPHFSRSFKNMLGVKPSKAYNSRIIQG